MRETGEPRVNGSARLSPEEERALAVLWHKEGDEAARQRILTAHFDLVRGVVNRIRSRSKSAEDLFQDGVLGLMRALDRFDPETGNRFSTYAIFWVKAEVQSALGIGSGAVRVPRSERAQRVAAWYSQVRSQVEREIALGLISSPMDGIDREVARRIGINPDDIGALLSLTQTHEVRIDTSPDEEEEGKAGWTLYTEETPEGVLGETQEQELYRAAIQDAMTSLNERERDVLQSRYLRDEPETLQLIAERIGLTRERIRQIEVRALEKVRKRLRTNRPVRDAINSRI